MGFPGNLKLWPGRGDGTFVVSSQVTTGWNFTQTIAADLDGNGTADLIASDSSGNLKMWTHNSAGCFNSPVQITTSWNFTQTAAGDFTKDGVADLIVRDNSTGTLKIWPGEGNGKLAASNMLTTGW